MYRMSDSWPDDSYAQVHGSMPTHTVPASAARGPVSFSQARSGRYRPYPIILLSRRHSHYLALHDASARWASKTAERRFLMILSWPCFPASWISAILASASLLA